MFEIAVAPGLLEQIEATNGHLTETARFREVDLDTPDRVASGTSGACALVVTLQPMRAEHIAALSPSVRVIGRAGVGLDSIDLAAAAEHGVAVINQPDYATAEVATHAVAMMLAAHRRLVAADEVARGDWAAWPSIGRIVPIEEQTVGVVGGGRIGRAVMERLHPYVGELLLHDPQLDSAPHGVELVAELDTLLSRSNIVTLHLPLTDGTRNIIDAHALKTMPEGAILVNVSRGGLVDERALVESIRDEHLAGAALDVMAQEPLDPQSPLRSERRILLSPHIGWYSESASVRLWRMTVDGVLQYLQEEPIIAGNLAVRGNR